MGGGGARVRLALLRACPRGLFAGPGLAACQRPRGGRTARGATARRGVRAGDGAAHPSLIRIRRSRIEPDVRLQRASRSTVWPAGAAASSSIGVRRALDADDQAFSGPFGSGRLIRAEGYSRARLRRLLLLLRDVDEP